MRVELYGCEGTTIYSSLIMFYTEQVQFESLTPEIIAVWKQQKSYTFYGRYNISNYF